MSGCNCFRIMYIFQFLCHEVQINILQTGQKISSTLSATRSNNNNYINLSTAFVWLMCDKSMTSKDEDAKIQEGGELCSFCDEQKKPMLNNLSKRYEMCLCRTWIWSWGCLYICTLTEYHICKHSITYSKQSIKSIILA